MIDKISIVVGLGNPGRTYANTYHNVGQQFVSFLGSDEHFSSPHSLFLAHTLLLENEKKIILVIPQTFMNDSGKAVRAALHYYKTTPQHLLVAHDEFDIPLGDFRFSQNRGSAGHHGIDSIIQELGSKEFSRLRIGIRTTNRKAESLVLRPISEKNKKILQGVFAGAREKFIEKL